MVIVVPKNTEDVAKAVTFAVKYGLQVKDLNNVMQILDLID